MEIIKTEEHKNRFGVTTYTLLFNLDGEQKVVSGQLIKPGTKVTVGRVRGHGGFVLLNE